MALSKKALQSKREKKKKKRPLKVAHVPASSVTYSNWPLYECLIPAGLWEIGIGQVVVSRKNSQDVVAMGIYLIDVFCLGIKGSFLTLFSIEDYENFKNHLRGKGEELKLSDPVYVNTLIHRAAEYAEQFGLKPDPDFANTKGILKNISQAKDIQFTFGVEGKPCYVQGTHESLRDARKILNTLEVNAGSGNYHFILQSLNTEILLENNDG